MLIPARARRFRARLRGMPRPIHRARTTNRDPARSPSTLRPCPGGCPRARAIARASSPCARSPAVVAPWRRRTPLSVAARSTSSTAHRAVRVTLRATSRAPARRATRATSSVDIECPTAVGADGGGWRRSPIPWFYVYRGLRPGCVTRVGACGSERKGVFCVLDVLRPLYRACVCVCVYR